MSSKKCIYSIKTNQYDTIYNLKTMINNGIECFDHYLTHFMKMLQCHYFTFCLLTNKKIFRWEKSALKMFPNHTSKYNIA